MRNGPVPAGCAMEQAARAACVSSDRSSDDVESRLARLARSEAPLRRALAAIAGRLVATRAWERLGFARLRDYAVERLGLSARQVQDLAHVDAELAKLPGVEAAFVSGLITWTKARRSGNPQTGAQGRARRRENPQTGAGSTRRQRPLRFY